MKHGYAIRSGLADPYFYGQEMLDLEERCSNPEEIEERFLIKTQFIVRYQVLIKGIKETRLV